MSTKRVFAFIIFVIAVLIGLFHPLLASAPSTTGSSAYEPSSITNFEADYTVDSAGMLTATEVVTVSLPAGRHGIFQFFDVADQSDPKVRYYPQISSVRPKPSRRRLEQIRAIRSQHSSGTSLHPAGR